MNYKFLLDVVNWLVCILFLGPWLISSTDTLLVLLGFFLVLCSTVVLGNDIYKALIKGNE